MNEWICINCDRESTALEIGVDELGNDFCKYCGSDEGFKEESDETM